MLGHIPFKKFTTKQIRIKEKLKTWRKSLLMNKGKSK